MLAIFLLVLCCLVGRNVSAFVLTRSNLSLLYSSDQTWFVHFTRQKPLSTHAVSFDASWAAALLSRPSLLTAVVFCDNDPVLCRQLGVFTYPEVRVVRNGDWQQKTLRFQPLTESSAQRFIDQSTQLHFDQDSSWEQPTDSLRSAVALNEIDLADNLAHKPYTPTLLMLFSKKQSSDCFQWLPILTNIARNTMESVEDAALMFSHRALRDSDLEEVERLYPVFFLYAYDYATTTEDFEAVKRWMLELTGFAPLFFVSSKSINERYKITSLPSLVAVRDGIPITFGSRKPGDLRNFKTVLPWLRQYSRPLLSEFSVENCNGAQGTEFSRGKDLAVFMFLHPDSDSYMESRHNFRNIARGWMEHNIQQSQEELAEVRRQKYAAIESAKSRGNKRLVNRLRTTPISVPQPQERVLFAWMDHSYHQEWVEKIFGESLPTTLQPLVRIVNLHTNRYYAPDFTDELSEHGSLNATSFYELLVLLLENPMSLPSYPLTGNGLCSSSHSWLGNTLSHSWLLAHVFLVSLMALVIFLVPFIVFLIRRNVLRKSTRRQFLINIFEGDNILPKDD
ncbi:protein disulfide isomerase [Schizosaccharomyces japonicus yFS275]|uniref:Protein disulfide isomerase n=1 Tax=Schizosaccharomyces japonicus (strain yFS275 / FY16936) TaxID=402676 RepID=B6K828_SCHJY|nr:protein disulfide isomerase [Schizosaccharomyces japonicus yFS275]EEB09682.1 protein disulfide isomerase [Schizosaccharomyces japonicus yFS275]